MRIVPRMVLIVNWDPPSAIPGIQLIQTQTRLLLVIGIQEEIPILTLLQKIKRRRAPQVGHRSTVSTAVRQVKQTRFCWTFNGWRAIATSRTSPTISTKFVNCQKPSLQRCQLSIGSQESLSCLNICSQPVSKSTINSQRNIK